MPWPKRDVVVFTTQVKGKTCNVLRIYPLIFTFHCNDHLLVYHFKMVNTSKQYLFIEPHNKYSLCTEWRRCGLKDIKSGDSLPDIHFFHLDFVSISSYVLNCPLGQTNFSVGQMTINIIHVPSLQSLTEASRLQKEREQQTTLQQTHQRSICPETCLQIV